MRTAIAIGVAAIGVAAPAGQAAASGVCGAGGSLAFTKSQLSFNTNTYTDIDVVDAASGSQRTVAHTVNSGWTTQPSWSPDGRWLAYGLTTETRDIPTSGQLRIVASDAARRSRVVTVRLAGAVSEVAWSPSGERIAFVVYTRNTPVEYTTWTPVGDRTTIFVVNRDGTHLKPVLSVSANVVSDLVWAPDGRHLAFANGFVVTTIDVVDVDAVVPLALAVSPRTMTASNPRWSPDGRRLAFTAALINANVLNTAHVWVADRAGKNARRLPLKSWDAPTWSPDNRWLAVAVFQRGIAAAHIDTGEIRTLTHGSFDRAAAWSPDGSRIAFVRQTGQPAYRRNATITIWTVDAHTGAARPVGRAGYATLSRPGYDIAPVWCPAQ